MKIAINRCFGGFGLSKAVYKELGIKHDGCLYLNNRFRILTTIKELLPFLKLLDCLLIGRTQILS